MKLEEICISLDLAKKMKELGVKQESLFYWYKLSIQKDYSLEMRRHMTTGELIVADCSDYISAFNTSELGELLPLGFETIKKENAYNALYPTGTYSAKACIAKNEANARAMLLILLIESGIYKQ